MGKTKEIKVLQGNYGYGWDDLIKYEKPYNLQEMERDVVDYCRNKTTPYGMFKVITRRVPKED